LRSAVNGVLDPVDIDRALHRVLGRYDTAKAIANTTGECACAAAGDPTEQLPAAAPIPELGTAAEPGEHPAEQQETADPDPPWPTPQPLTVAPTALPTAALGDVLGPYTDALSTSLQVPSDLVVNLALPIITTAAAGRWKVRVTGDWVETLALGSVSALASGERKSATMAALIAPLRAHERQAQQDAAPRVEEAKHLRQLQEDRVKALRHAAVRAGRGTGGEAARARREHLAEVRNLTDLRTETLPRWTVDDATPEALAKVMGDQHGAIGLMSTEAGFFGTLAGRYSSGAVNLDVVLKGISGDSIRVDRASRDPVIVDDPCLSLSLCIQPGMLSTLGERPELRASGMLARFLYTVPAPRIGTRAIHPPPVPPELTQRWKTALTRLAARAHHIEGHHELELTQAALDVLDHFRGQLEPLLAPVVGRLADISDWASKLPGAIARIAGALTLLEDPNAQTITAATMRNAVDLGRAYAHHATAAFSLVHGDDRRTRAREVLAWIARHGGETTVRDLHRGMQGRAWVTTKDDLTDPVELLVDQGHARLVQLPSTGGRPPSPRVVLHPTHRDAGPDQ